MRLIKHFSMTSIVAVRTDHDKRVRPTSNFQRCLLTYKLYDKVVKNRVVILAKAIRASCVLILMHLL